MGRLNVYVPDELAEAAREAGLNISALTQAAISTALARRATGQWIAALPPSEHDVSPDELLAAVDAAREELGA